MRAYLGEGRNNMSKITHCTVITILAALSVTGLVVPLPEPAAADWKPAAAPLLTPWAKDVSPDKVWPEYPRPQMVRSDWVNLNGLWDYAIVPIARISDSSGNKQDGNAAGAPTWKVDAGPDGGAAFEFNGSGDAVRIPR